MYDFTSVVNRKGTGSLKWEQMYECNSTIEQGIIPFSIADMELKLAPEIIQGLKNFIDNTVLGYTTPYSDYLDAVKNWIKRRHNYNVDKKWIVSTNGVIAGISAAIRGLTEEGDGVIIMPPVYYPFYDITVKNKRIPVSNPLLNYDGYYSIDFDRLEMLLKDKKNKMLLFCSPHNPVGRVWKIEELERLSSLCIENNIIVVSDEIHSDIVMEGNTHTVLASISKEMSNITITCTSPSKSFNLAGLGVANIIISNKEIREEFKYQIDAVSGNMFGIIGYKACEIAYNEAEKWLDNFLVLVDKNQRFVNSYLERNIPLINAPLIEGTYLQWLDFRNLGLNNEELTKFLHEKPKLFLDDGYIFGVEGSGYERLNLAEPTWVIEEAMDRLKTSITKYI